jgi:hypothetical protein
MGVLSFAEGFPTRIETRRPRFGLPNRRGRPRRSSVAINPGCGARQTRGALTQARTRRPITLPPSVKVPGVPKEVPRIRPHADHAACRNMQGEGNLDARRHRWILGTADPPRHRSHGPRVGRSGRSGTLSVSHQPVPPSKRLLRHDNVRCREGSSPSSGERVEAFSRTRCAPIRQPQRRHTFGRVRKRTRPAADRDD